MTELDLLREVADVAGALVWRIEADAARGRLHVEERYAVELGALREALAALERIDEAEAELERIRAKFGGGSA